jgi:hypothetical protein
MYTTLNCLCLAVLRAEYVDVQWTPSCKIKGNFLRERTVWNQNRSANYTSMWLVASQHTFFMSYVCMLKTKDPFMAMLSLDYSFLYCLSSVSLLDSQLQKLRIVSGFNGILYEKEI